MLGTEFPVISTGNLYTAIDTYASTITTQPPTNTPSNPNGALNPAGSVYLLAPGAGEGPSILYAKNGWGAPLVVRYVRYNSTTNAALLATPAPVWWTDETFTTVSGTYSEGLGGGSVNNFAGLLLVNSVSLGSTGAAGATTLNGNWCFIVTQGWVPNVTVPGSTAVGDVITGTTGNFSFTRTASGSSSPSLRYCQALTAIANSVADVLVNTDITV